ncbi:MAG TPA: hypothetical protein VGP72_28275 [Planctomycetota bacterium]|jgi:hypothetical protein
MWHTSLGDRTLIGGEAALFKHGLRSLLDILSIHPGWPSGVHAFDELAYSQKIALLWEVGSALLLPKTPEPKQTAANEAAVAAVFAHLKELIDHELHQNGRGRPVVRTMIAECLRADFVRSGRKCPRPLSDDAEEWDRLVDECADRILWDHDFEVGGWFLDSPPEQASVLRELLRIDDDYYAEAPPDLPPAQIADRVQELRKLVG